jgi:hypothetical protein
MSPKAAFYDEDDMHDEWSDEEEFWDQDEGAESDLVEPAKVCPRRWPTRRASSLLRTRTTMHDWVLPLQPLVTPTAAPPAAAPSPPAARH